MFIKAQYYPGTNDSTYTDKGYQWEPAIGGGYYTYIKWHVTWESGGGFSVTKGKASQVWSISGGPQLQDPYNPASTPSNVVITAEPLTVRIYVNGHSVDIIEHKFEYPSGIIAPLQVGPV